jgi:hypothetical protein
MPVGTARARINRASSRIQNGKRSGIERHPVTGETSPNCRWRICPTTSTGSLRHKEKEIHPRVPEKAVHHVAHPAGRILQDDLPKIPPVHVPDKALGDEHSREPHHENSDVKHPREYLLSVAAISFTVAVRGGDPHGNRTRQAEWSCMRFILARACDQILLSKSSIN